MDFPPASPPHNHDEGITAPRVSPPARDALAKLSRADNNLRDLDGGLAGISAAVTAFSNLAGSIAGSVNAARETFLSALDAAAADRVALASAQHELAEQRKLLTQLRTDLTQSQGYVKHWKDLVDTESRLRIEDAERHKAEIARLTAAPVEITDKGRAAVATAPKRLSKPAVVLDPDGHPVSNHKPGTKKAR